ncbi:hypothetical protein BHAOGJBA_4490 [Methylobacterium hispanicum]|uniref:Uncharacterized protein n=1 Tax=Methylobacterium hispanicum TaxID=270350 RepID=A0AAV4ZS99_9HYPH|nr:hypothetical protein [Methylobacterium hispanicum]GJD90946.1 hypothetical protein BHAOGJBA_4490 [Methylobacterium hispanicum]
MDADSPGTGRYEAVACTSLAEIVLWVHGGTRTMLGFARTGVEEGHGAVQAMHRADARVLAAAEVADREKTTFGFYANEVLRANLWPTHCNDGDEAAEQIERVREGLAIALRNEDPFRAAVEFEQRIGTTCDVRLVRLFEDTLPWVAEAAATPSTLNLAAAQRERLFLAKSPMAAALKRTISTPPAEEPTGPRP